MQEYKLSEISTIENGGTPSTEVEKYWNGDIPWITPFDLSKTHSKWIKCGERNITKEGVNNSNAKIVPPRSIMISTRAPIGYIVMNEFAAATNQGMKSVIPKNEIVDTEYLYYLLRTKVKEMNLKAGGTTFKEISTSVFKGLKITLPSIEEQKIIGNKLSKIDDKIETNNSLIGSLEEYSQLLFYKWFVDFNFPDENGNPYKDNGGKLVEVKEKMIPIGWHLSNVGKLSLNFDSKRIPVSDYERINRKGKYPYYGATKIMDYIDDFIFDGTYCLIAEDGSVMDENFRPIMQYVSGKFWVNNHTHVLQGNKVSTEYLYLSLSRTNVMSAITGAIQKKINQQNLNKLPIIQPSEEVSDKFDLIIKPIFSRIEALKKENCLLIEIRDLLINKFTK